MNGWVAFRTQRERKPDPLDTLIQTILSQNTPSPKASLNPRMPSLNPERTSWGATFQVVSSFRSIPVLADV
jgi:endonuclease III